MKSKVIIGLFVILFISFTSAIPYILFVDPTPVEGYSTTSSGSFEINMSLNEVDSLNELIWSWNNVNYSLYDEDLVLMYNFENNSLLGENDSVVVDLSRYGNNGSIINGNNISDGKFGYGAGFNESNYINISNDLNLTDRFTISLLVNLQKENFTDIFLGGYHSCAKLQNGSIVCFGRNMDGEFGDGTTIQRTIPKIVLENYNFSLIYLGLSHTCGVLENGSTLCWGENTYGQLGNGSIGNSNIPIFVKGEYNFTFISLSSYSSCALLENGSALCWGRNNYGQLGIGNTTNMYTPTYVLGGHNFSKISDGEDLHFCGILHNGSVMCWGQNNYGQLGIGNTTNMYTPTYVLGGHNFKSIFCGYRYSCGLLNNGSVMCWGQNNYGQLGNGSTGGSKNYPDFIYGNYNFSELFSKRLHSCGMLQNKSTLCWGYNNAGQIGDGTTINRDKPTFILNDPLFDKISIGHSHNCGLKNNSIYCWGNNRYGQIGNSIKGGTEIPLFTLGNYSFNKLSGGDSHYCGILYNGSLLCWGDNTYGELGKDDLNSLYFPKIINNYVFLEVSSGRENSCGIQQNGSALCWGRNDYGQLGIGNTTNMYTPTYVLGGHNFSSISLGAYHTCGLLQNGSAMCWGQNNYGQLGIGNTTNMYTPYFISEGNLFKNVYAGLYHSCGLLHNGSTLCWGYNSRGELGIGNTTNMYTPQFVLGNYNFSMLSIYPHNCGLLYNGSVMCWGTNANGQLGIGNTTNMYTPTYVLGGHNFSKISSGLNHICGLLQNGSMLCWGINIYGMLGIGIDNTTDMYIPTYVIGGHNFSDLPKGIGQTSCGILQNRKVLCWGNSNSGETGTGIANPPYPVEVSKGTIFGNNPYIYNIYSTYSGNINGFVGGNLLSSSLSSEWNQITFSFDGETKLYTNGILENSIDYNLTLIDLNLNDLIGQSSLSIIDEVRVYNRSLSASEVQQLYRTNLMKKNMTSWEFYANESLSSGDKTYTYGLFGKDSVGVTFSLLRNIIKYSLSSDDEDEEESSSGSEFKEITLNKNSLKKGFNLNVKENLEIEIPVDGLSENKIITVKDINPNTDEVVLTSGSEEYSLLLGEGIKIDLDNDGYYDIEVINKKNYGTVSNLEFKSIYEKIQAEEQEEVIEEVEEVESEDNLGIDESKKENKLLKIILIILIGVVLCVGIILGHKKIKKKKRYKKFGY